MRIIYILLVIVSFLIGCAEKSKKESNTEISIKTNGEKNETSTKKTSNFAKTNIQELDELLNSNRKIKDDTIILSEKLPMEYTNVYDRNNSIGGMHSTEAFLGLLEASGVSREEIEKLLNNPEKLKKLADEAEKNREIERLEKEDKLKDGKLSKQQLTSKNTPTGISLEEAILLVQAESGPEATLAKLKKIDSLAGTNVMEQLDLTEAGYVMRDVKRKNEPKASPEEEQKIKALNKKSGQMHSIKQAKTLLAELEQAQNDIASGKVKASPRYQEVIKHKVNSAKIFHTDMLRKSERAKQKFKQLNPDLYFGDEVGQTYFGDNKKAVYLPLGNLSFADKVVSVNHPLLMTQDVNNVTGEPDVIKGFLAEDISGIYSLGLGGDLTIQFVNNALTDVNGPDLYIFEIGQVEPTNLEISKNGKEWIKVGKIDGGVAEVDISSYVKQDELFYYVRLKDLKQESGLPGADVDAIAAIGAAMRLKLDSKVLFDIGKSELKPKGIEAIQELAKSIKILEKGKIIVEGHTDDVGSTATNQKLSLARAKSVSSELKKIIPSNKFRWQEKGLGKSKPLVKNDSDENRAKNRRVEVLILPN